MNPPNRSAVRPDESINPPNGHSWKTAALNWLFHQGVSTVILFFILFGIYWGVPLWIEQQAAIDKSQRDDFIKTLNYQQDSFLSSIKLLRDDNNAARTEQRQDFLKSLEKITSEWTQVQSRGK